MNLEAHGSRKNPYEGGEKKKAKRGKSETRGIKSGRILEGQRQPR